jgi:hypothetical protein
MHTIKCRIIFTIGITFGMMIIGVIMTSKYASKIRECKMRLLHKLK